MSDFKEYDQYDGLGLAELIRAKQISAAEVCEAAIARIERLNPQINAVVLPMFEIGRGVLSAGRLPGRLQRSSVSVERSAGSIQRGAPYLWL